MFASQSRGFGDTLRSRLNGGSATIRRKVSKRLLIMEGSGVNALNSTK
jgi:hypothetical protein